MNILRTIRLTNTTGTAFKEYRVQIEHTDDRYHLRGYNGRINGHLTPRNKGSFPSPEQADNAFVKLVNEKTREGYVIDESQSDTVAGIKERTPTHLPVQLLTAIDEADARALVADDAIVAQEKHNGTRLLTKTSTNGVIAANKKGIATPIPSALAQALATAPIGSIFDGELVQGQFRIFDLLGEGDTNLRALPYEQRYNRLQQMIAPLLGKQIALVTTAIGGPAKTRLIEDLQHAEAEGVVFKDRRQQHAAGRAKAGPWKWKFFETASFICIAGPTDARSVELGLLDEAGALASCGRVGVPESNDVPQVDSIIEVRYLYAYRKSNALHIPIFLGDRTDEVSRDECTLDQLKYHSEVP